MYVRIYVLYSMYVCMYVLCMYVGILCMYAFMYM